MTSRTRASYPATASLLKACSDEVSLPNLVNILATGIGHAVGHASYPRCARTKQASITRFRVVRDERGGNGRGAGGRR
jgi:hypothetical protein